MVDQDDLVKKRKGRKLFCTVRGKGVLESIYQNLDPDFVEFKFEQYCEAASKVLEVCNVWLELTTFDEMNSQKDIDIYMEHFHKERNSIIQKYERFRENAAKIEENTGKDEMLKIDENIVETDEMIKGNVENFAFRNKVKDQEDKVSEQMNISDFELKDVQIGKNFCDVTLACDDIQNLTQKLVIASRSEEQMLAECKNKSKDEPLTLAVQSKSSDIANQANKFIKKDQPGASLLSRSLFFSWGLLDYGHSSVTIVVKKLANKLALVICYFCGKISCKESSDKLNRIGKVFYLSVKVYS